MDKEVTISKNHLEVNREIAAIKSAIAAWEGKKAPATLKGLSKELFEKMSKEELYDYLEEKEQIAGS